MGVLQIFAAILTEEAILYTLSFLQGYKFIEYQCKCQKGLQIVKLFGIAKLYIFKNPTATHSNSRPDGNFSQKKINDPFELLRLDGDFAPKIFSDRVF